MSHVSRNVYVVEGAAGDTTLGQRIAEARGRMTQKKLAELIDKTTASVSNYERGEREPSPAVLRRIAEVTRTDLGWLLYGDVERDRQAAIMKKLDAILNRLGVGVSPPAPEGELGRRTAKPRPSDGSRRRKPKPEGPGAAGGSTQ